ncbi:MAG: class II aldolase/adducin family protein [Kofleriaceae bacterium]
MRRALASEIARACHLLHERGWVANHDGNVTARDGARLLATPTATSKRLVTEASLLEVDLRGQVMGGTGKVFGELGLHLVVYERRPDVGAVVHAHPPMATAVASSPRAEAILARPFLPEAVVSLGPVVPTVPLALPGEAARQALAPWCEWVDVVLLANHGVLAWGATVEQALLRLELVEHLARIAISAEPLGGVRPLPDAFVESLMPARAKAGLGRAADRAVEVAARLAGTPSAGKGVVACAPAPHSSTVVLEPPRAREPDLIAVVREEIMRALRESSAP